MSDINQVMQKLFKEDDAKGLKNHIEEHNINVNKPYVGNIAAWNNTLLAQAIENNAIECVKWLITSGATMVLSNNEHFVHPIELFIKKKMTDKTLFTLLISSFPDLAFHLESYKVKNGADIQSLFAFSINYEIEEAFCALIAQFPHEKVDISQIYEGAIDYLFVWTKKGLVNQCIDTASLCALYLITEDDTESYAHHKVCQLMDCLSVAMTKDECLMTVLHNGQYFQSLPLKVKQEIYLKGYPLSADQLIGLLACTTTSYSYSVSNNQFILSVLKNSPYIVSRNIEGIFDYVIKANELELFVALSELSVNSLDTGIKVKMQSYLLEALREHAERVLVWINHINSIPKLQSLLVINSEIPATKASESPVTADALDIRAVSQQFVLKKSLYLDVENSKEALVRLFKVVDVQYRPVALMKVVDKFGLSAVCKAVSKKEEFTLLTVCYKPFEIIDMVSKKFQKSLLIGLSA